MKIKKLLICLTAIGCIFAFTGCERNVNNGNDMSETIGTTASGNVVVDETRDNVMTTDDRNDIVDDTAAVEGETSAADFEDAKGLDTAPDTGIIEVNATPVEIIEIVEITEVAEVIEVVEAMASAVEVDMAYTNKKIGWGLGKAADENGRPLDAINANEKYGDLGGIFVGESENKVYLTFDEGYENGYTSRILDILKEKNVRATFFVTYDYCRNEPDLVKRMIDEGHVVGNHSYTHPSLPDCSDGEVSDEIMQLHNYVEREFGYTMDKIRPPMGEFSERTLAISNSLGYKSVFWSFAHVDWDTANQPTSEQAYTRVTSSTHPGAIVLLHAVSSANTDALADIIDYWQENEYEIALLK